MAKLLMAPPTPCSNSRDYSKDDDSDSDVSEDSLGKVLFYFFQSVDALVLTINITTFDTVCLPYT